MDPINTNTAAELHLAELEKNLAPSTARHHRAALIRLAKISPELPMSRKAFEQYLGDPETTTPRTRRLREHIASRLFKSDAVQKLGIADVSAFSDESE